MKSNIKKISVFLTVFLAVVLSSCDADEKAGEGFTVELTKSYETKGNEIFISGIADITDSPDNEEEMSDTDESSSETETERPAVTMQLPENGDYDLTGEMEEFFEGCLFFGYFSEMFSEAGIISSEQIVSTSENAVIEDISSKNPDTVIAFGVTDTNLSKQENANRIISVLEDIKEAIPDARIILISDPTFPPTDGNDETVNNKIYDINGYMGDSVDTLGIPKINFIHIGNVYEDYDTDFDEITKKVAYKIAETALNYAE